MAWAVAYRNRVHLVGGYAEQRVDRPYHHAYDAGGRPLGRAAATAARRQPRRRRDAGRSALCLRRLHRAEPHAARRVLCLRRRRLATHPPLARSLRRDVVHRARPAHAPDRRCDRQRLAPFDRLAHRLRPGQRTATSGASRCRWRATTRASSSWRHDPCHRRSRRLLPHQQQPAPQLRRRAPTAGSSARRCPRRAPVTAACSTAARSS